MTEHTPENDAALLALLGEPIRAYPQIWSLQDWWEWHARVMQHAVTSSAETGGAS